MLPPLWNRRLRQLHLWFAVAIGAQVALWLISGFYMVITDIDKVRGTHLRQAAVSAPLEAGPDSLPAAEDLADVLKDVLAGLGEAQEITLRRRDGQLVWQLGKGPTQLLDATSGEALAPLTEDAARRLGQAAYAGRGGLTAALFMEEAPREAASPDALWRLSFGPQDRADVYLNAMTGDVRAVRTPGWRLFDLMWGLHIMDWSSRENFNSWWVRMTAGLALIFLVSGIVLTVMRVTQMVRGRKRR